MKRLAAILATLGVVNFAIAQQVGGIKNNMESSFAGTSALLHPVKVLMPARLFSNSQPSPALSKLAIPNNSLNNFADHMLIAEAQSHDRMPVYFSATNDRMPTKHMLYSLKKSEPANFLAEPVMPNVNLPNTNGLLPPQK